MSDLPFVSVITPVFNGEKYLAECIESVINQEYDNWEYIIVNNCSTDRTLEISESFAETEKRIRIVSNTSFVGAIENHNIAFKLISPASAYCKVVSADDWLYPECLAKLVAVGEMHPSVGMVGCYALAGNRVHLIDLPVRTSYVAGQEAGRMQLLGLALFKPPSSLLYRTEMIMAVENFYEGVAANADMDAFFRDMQKYDFGCVHQILNFERIHDESVTSDLKKFNSLLIDRLEFLVRYGPCYLDRQENEKRMLLLLDEYYEFLAERTIHLVGSRFWEYQKARLAEVGRQINSYRLFLAVFAKCMDLLLNPKQTIEKIARRLTVK
jgi:glycosyltransferase involved in cell wall biosynthesis